MKYLLNKLSETRRLAKILAGEIKHKSRLITFLSGDLGSGKTTFTHFVLNYLGIKDFNGSPSFSIINEYNIRNKTIIHMDLYRIESRENIHLLGIYEYFEKNAIFFVEWPNLLEFKPDVMIQFTLINKIRSIKIDWIED